MIDKHILKDLYRYLWLAGVFAVTFYFLFNYVIFSPFISGSPFNSSIAYTSIYFAPYVLFLAIGIAAIIITNELKISSKYGYYQYKSLVSRKKTIFKLALPITEEEYSIAMMHGFVSSIITSAGEHMEILKKDLKKLDVYGRPYFSFEFFATSKEIQLFLVFEEKYKDIVKNSLYTYYKHIHIEEVPDYLHKIDFKKEDSILWGESWHLKNDSEYTLTPYKELEDRITIEPLVPMLEILSDLEEGEYLGIQFVFRTEYYPWRRRSSKDDIFSIGYWDKKTLKERTEQLVTKRKEELNFKPDTEQVESETINLEYLNRDDSRLFLQSKEYATTRVFQTSIRTMYVAPRVRFSETKLLSLKKMFTVFDNKTQELLTSDPLKSKTSKDKHQSLSEQKIFFNLYRMRASNIAKHIPALEGSSVVRNDGVIYFYINVLISFCHIPNPLSAPNKVTHAKIKQSSLPIDILN